MLSKIILSSLFATLLINFIECQQMLQLLTSPSNRNSQSSQSSAQQQPQQQNLQNQPQTQQQGLSLDQQQQLLQQLALLTSQQQQNQQQQRQQQQPPQQYPPQQFFDPNQQPYFGPQGGQSPPQQFFTPQQFVVRPQQQQQPQQQQPQQQQQQQQPQQQQPQQQQFQPQQQPPQSQSQPSQGPAINWGKCPQLEPSDKEKMTKAQVITKCLENTPLPANITRDSVEVHREQIAACALQNEGWFTSSGGYDFNKAENEIKNKKLNKTIEEQVLSYHKQCKEEAVDKYPTAKNTIIAQIQLYQACMDYFISDVCGIEVNEPEGPQFN